MRDLLRRLFRRRHAELDARLEQARLCAAEAEKQADLSEQRYYAVRRHVVDPLRQARERNGFADMLRASIIEGHGRGR